MSQTPLVVIVGETASGKTALGIELARKFNGEIICADSRTIYKEMDIGTAKPTREERELARHHMLDIVEPNEQYNAARFQADANTLIDEITARGKLPIMVGGTGLYVDSVIFDYDFENQTMSELRPNTLVIGIQKDKDELLSRIEKRVDAMIEQGFIGEVKHLGTKYGWECEALKVIGYKQFASYIRGESSLEEARAQTIRETKLFAKRQRTWFRRPAYQKFTASDTQTARNKSIHWVKNSGDAVKLATEFLSKIAD